VEYVWDEPAGEAGLGEALGIVDAARSHPSGLISGIVMPAQVDTCTPDLLLSAYEAARRRGAPLQIHAAQSVPEFHEMIRRHGTTAVRFLHDLGVLDGTCIAHAIFIDRHPWIGWHEERDVEILAEAGASVAHCPVTFAYRGALMHDFGAYRRAGVNMAMGTDTFPHDMVSEMRSALFGAKAARGHVDHTRTEDVFRAATLGGAKALGRDDIGRLAPGARADFFTVDLAHPAMRPCRDPLRSFVYSGGGRAVRDVYVNGERIVQDRRHLTIDLGEALAAMDLGHAAAMRDTASRDWAHRSADEISPLSLPLRD
jgi:cytosine/adenosine deaminase-related metal-dependent hydrolase